MELITFLVTTVIAYCGGYYFGVISGYGTKLREEHKTTHINILVEFHDGIYLFYNYITGEYITQSASIKEGIEKLRTLIGKKLIVIRGDSLDD